MRTVTKLQAVSSGSDWFEWVIDKHCKSVAIAVKATGSAYIESLSLNNREVNVERQAAREICNLVRLDDEWMLRPGDRVRIVARSKRGTRVSAQLEINLVS